VKSNSIIGCANYSW